MARIEGFLFQKRNSEYTEKSKVNTSTTKVHEAGHFSNSYNLGNHMNKLLTIYTRTLYSKPQNLQNSLKKNLQNSYQSLLSYINIAFTFSFADLHFQGWIISK